MKTYDSDVALALVQAAASLAVAELSDDQRGYAGNAEASFTHCLHVVAAGYESILADKPTGEAGQ